MEHLQRLQDSSQLMSRELLLIEIPLRFPNDHVNREDNGSTNLIFDKTKMIATNHMALRFLEQLSLNMVDGHRKSLDETS